MIRPVKDEFTNIRDITVMIKDETNEDLQNYDVTNIVYLNLFNH